MFSLLTNPIYKALAAFLFVVLPLTSQAQLRSTYFMRNSPEAVSQNPAVQPARGYVSIPIAGSINASYYSNDFGIKTIFPNVDGRTVTFMDPLVDAEKFLNSVNADNRFIMDLNTSLINVGWWSGKGFWTASMSLRTNFGANLPKSLLEFMKLDMNEARDYYYIDAFDLYLDSFVETSVGYSRPVTKDITVGGRFKFLTGIANFSSKFDYITAKADYENMRWEMESKGHMQARVKGLEPVYDIDDNGVEYIQDLDYDSAGISGFGAAVDVGVTYKVMEQLTLSASLLDLGFIKWRANSTISGSVDRSYYFDGFDIEDIESASDQFSNITSGLQELMHFEPDEAKSSTTSLRATINVGGEYTILDDLLGFGLLSSTKFYKPKAYTELTFMTNVRPNHWFTGTVSYSFVHSRFKSFGMALNFHPSWINFMIGSDYLFFNAKKGIPQFSNSANFFMGISVPLAAGPKCRKGSRR